MTVPGAARTRRRDTLALAIGSAVTGVLSYVFFAVATRSLGAADAAPVSVLWTYWTFAAAALTFPIQHWITRTVAARGEAGLVRAGLPHLVAVVLAVAVFAGVFAWLAREPLFHRPDAQFPLLVSVVTVGAAVVGVVRGMLAARQRFVSLAIAVAGENAVRCAAAALLVATGTDSAVDYGVALAAGSFVVLAWTSALRLPKPPAENRGVSPLRFLSASSGGQLLSQGVLTGGPVVLALAGGSATQVTALFAVLALFRAPYTLSLGVLPQLTWMLTALAVRQDLAALSRFRRTVCLATGSGAVMAGLFGAAFGPALVRLVFGSDIEVSSQVAALIAVGTAVAIGGLVLTIGVIAQDRPIAVLSAWMVAVIAGGTTFVLVVATGSSLDATCWAFVVAESVAFLVLLVEATRGAARLGARNLAARPA
jgi:O-antigen/teichoic acid export membrane protein